MSVGTPFHPRTSPLNRKMQWREWSGYFASSVYADAHDIEYNAIREAAALIDVSPLYKYLVTRARRPAPRRPGRHPRRDEAGRRRRHLHAVVRRARQGRRRRHDPPARRAALPLDRRRPAAPLAAPEQRRARRDDRRRRPRRPPRSRCRVRCRGTSSRPRPASRSRTCATSGAAPPTVGKVEVDVSRTGYTGDLGYELWIPTDGAVKVWDALMAAGRAYGDPAGGDARPRRRPARGRADPARGRLHVGPTRDEPRAELLARARSGSAGWSASTRATSSAVSRSSAKRRPAVRPGGWSASSSTGTTSRACTTRRACRRRSARRVDRAPVPVFAGGRQVGRATSHGWSPILKQAIALASVPPQYEAIGTPLAVEWTVEGRRGRVGATVVELPFLDLERKRA